MGGFVVEPLAKGTGHRLRKHTFRTPEVVRHAQRIRERAASSPSSVDRAAYGSVRSGYAAGCSSSGARWRWSDAERAASRNLPSSAVKVEPPSAPPPRMGSGRSAGQVSRPCRSGGVGMVERGDPRSRDARGAPHKGRGPGRQRITSAACFAGSFPGCNTIAVAAAVSGLVRLQNAEVAATCIECAEAC
jgi:hypothetical protein